MKIELDKEFLILSDSNQYVLAQNYGNGRYKNLSYCSSLVGLLRNYLDMKCRTAQNIDSIHKLIDYQKGLITRLNKLLQPLEYTIKSGESDIDDKES